MGFMDKIKSSFKESKEKRLKERAVFSKSLEDEKRKIKQERLDAKKKRDIDRLARVDERARARARNPLGKKILKGVVRSGKSVVEGVSKNVSSQLARMKADQEYLRRVREKARLREMARIEVSNVRKSFHPKKSVNKSGVGVNKNRSPDYGLDIFGSKSKKKKKSDDFFGGMI